MAEDGWYEKLRKKGYLGTQAQTEKGLPGQWEQEREQKNKEYQREVDMSEEEQRKREAKRRRIDQGIVD